MKSVNTWNLTNNNLHQLFKDDNEDNGMPPNMKKYFDEIRIEKEMIKKRERRLNAEKNEINKKF